MLKPYLSILFISVFTTVASAQENLDDLLAAGIQDAKTFTTDYIAPAEEGVSFGLIMAGLTMQNWERNSGSNFL